MKTKHIIITLLGIVIFAYIVAGYRNKVQVRNKPVVSISPIEDSKPVVVDYTATFVIFTNGIERNFTASMYHNQSKDVFIQNGKPSLVMVKKNGVTWGSFFETLPFSLSSKCLVTGDGETFCNGDKGGELRFFLNGDEQPLVLDQKISPDDQLLITFGTESEEEIHEQIERFSSEK